MKVQEMREIASIIVSVLKEAKPSADEKTGAPSRTKAYTTAAVLEQAKRRVAEVLKHFPLYPELVIEYSEEKKTR